MLLTDVYYPIKLARMIKFFLNTLLEMGPYG
jgi:hypothetical protein